MPARQSSVGLVVLAAVAGLQFAAPLRADAQSAWTPVAGEGSVALVFQNLEFSGHFDETGSHLDGVAASRAHLGILQFEYGLTDRLAFTARLPYIASKFTGTHEEPVMILIRERYEEYRRKNPGIAVDSSLDTGSYYATFQDVGFSLRYTVLNRGVTVTPLLAGTIPSHHYRTIGEAAPGQDRLALHTGVNVGWLFAPVLPDVYFHGRYTYSFVQRFRGIPLDRSSAELEAGYAVTPTFSVRALANWMETHGGVEFGEAYEDLELFLSHDRLLDGRYWHLGGATTLSLTDSIDLDGAVLWLFSGANTHSGLGINVGVTWRFLTSRVNHRSSNLRRQTVRAPSLH